MMDPKMMSDIMGSLMGQKGAPSLPGGMDAKGFTDMMDQLKEIQKDPEAMRQMEGYWKMLDNMNDKDPEQYKKFIDQQMDEMKEYREEEQRDEQLKRTINSDPYFCFSIRPARLVDQKAQEQKEDIKLFDFGSAEISESFVNNKDTGKPLESHKLYLNIVYHDRILPPLRKDKSFADPKDDN
jgi:hypothetical protein